nr:hypothetical protein [Tanacetum cinerariifolium]
MAQTDSVLTFNVRRRKPELIAPASPTPRKLKRLSDIDDQEGLQIHISAIFFYRPSANMQNKDPELLYDVPGSGGLLNSPLLLIQVARLLCGGFILTLRSSHPMVDGSRIVEFLTGLGEMTQGASKPSILPMWQKEAPRKSMSTHVLEMKGYMDQLHALRKSYDNDMAINLINRSLNKDFGDFVRNINRHCVGKTVTELHALLNDYEKGLRDKAPTPQVLTIQKGRENKPKPQANKKDKSKGKTDKNKKVMPYQPKPKHNPLKRKENPNKDQTCHHCHVAGYWKRNCPFYLEELRKNKDKAEHGAVASGYHKETISYYFYFPPENKLIVARYGNLLERDLISQKFSGRDNDLEDDHMDTLPSENTSEIPVESKSLGSSLELIPVRGSKRTTSAPNRLCLNIEVEDDEVGKLGEPANYKSAMLDPNKVIWQGAMDEEMNFMKVIKVWIVVDLPPNAKVVRSKWLYKKKTDMDGKVYTYKARLVAKGYTQTYKIDYEETFSPVTDIRAIRILIAIAAYYDYEIWKMDVKTAFLNGHLDEDIYMEQPEGDLKRKGNCLMVNNICKWAMEYKQQLKVFKSEVELQLGKKIKALHFDRGGEYLSPEFKDYLRNNLPRLKEVKDYLEKCFSMKDLGEAAYILGIKIYRDRSRPLIRLSQSAYIDKILKKCKMHNSKKGYLPMEVKHDLINELCASTPEEVAYMKKVPYALAVRSIMYAIRCTRPDVAFAQNLVMYGGKPDTELDVTGFCDASWQCDKDDTKSQMGYVFVVNRGAKPVWIRKFVGDLGVMPLINKPINMYCDNSAAIIFVNEPGIMKGTIHFLRRYHYVREQVETGEIKLIKVHTDDNLADPFTKALPRGMVIDHAKRIGLLLASRFMHTCD